MAIWYGWNSARKRAGLAHVRIHDLRHSFASFLVNSGRGLYEVQRLLGHAHIKTTQRYARGLYEVQRLLGHAHIKTTQRYAHLSNETLISAANTASSFMPGVPTAPVSWPVTAEPLALPTP